MEAVIGALKAARQAPSGANRQPWRFILVDDPELKGRIRRASERGEREMYEKVTGEFREWLLGHGLSQRKPFLEEAPLLVVVLMDRSAPYARESVWVAIGFILLALEESGLSTLPYTPSNTRYPLDELDAPIDRKQRRHEQRGLHQRPTGNSAFDSLDPSGLVDDPQVGRWNHELANDCAGSQSPRRRGSGDDRLSQPPRCDYGQQPRDQQYWQDRPHRELADPTGQRVRQLLVDGEAGQTQEETTR